MFNAEYVLPRKRISYHEFEYSIHEGPDGGVPKSIINKNIASKSLINKIKSKSIKCILSDIGGSRNSVMGGRAPQNFSKMG